MKHEANEEGNSALEVVEFAQLDTSFAVNPKDEGTVRRKYMTVLAQRRPTTDHLSDCEVLAVHNTEGDLFALKRLRPLPTDTDPLSRRGREAALFEEYRTMLAVSSLRGFPRVYGYGVTRAGDPAILMEWIPGKTLLAAERAHDLPLCEDGNGCTGHAVAALALGALQTLVSTSCLDGTFIHRDISPRNIMVLSANGDSGDVLDLRLIDLGSSIFMSRTEATFTRTMDVWRAATPEYAPPEMLALDDRSYIEARRSPSIDVYALASVLYEMYGGRTPFRLSEHPGGSAFKIKTSHAPEPLVPHIDADQPLIDALMPCLSASPHDRPSASELFRGIAAWQEKTTGHAIELVREQAPKVDGKAHLESGYVSAYAPSVPIAGPTTPAGEKGTAAPQASEDKIVISRRSLLIGAGCAVGAAALGIAAYRTQLFGALAEHGLNDSSWDELSKVARKIANAGDSKEALSLAVKYGIARKDGSIAGNLTKDIELQDGTKATVRIVGYHHDDRSDGKGKAGLTFAFRAPVAARNMSDAKMAQGGWKDCDMRAWLNDDFLAMLPEELSSVIVPVSKLTNNAGATRSADSVTATKDSVWLFSMAELGGTRTTASFSKGYGYLAGIINAEGTQYRYWKDRKVSTNARANGATAERWKGSKCYWWTRSPSPDCSEDDGQTWFNRVGPSGDVFRFAVAATGDDNDSTVLPGFAI